MISILVYILWLGICFYLSIFGYGGAALLIISIICPLVSMILNRFSSEQISAEIEDKTFQKSENVSLKIIIFGRGSFIKGKICCENCLTNEKQFFQFEGIATKRGLELELDYFSSNCGKINVYFLFLRRYDLFRLTYKNMKVQIDSRIFCLPQIDMQQIDDTIMSITDCESGKYTEIQGNSDHSEVYGTREYLAGDSYKDIHWKQSFRLNNLYVKEYSTEQSSNICLLYGGTSNNYLINSTNAEKILSFSRAFLEADIKHYIALKNQFSDQIYFDEVEDDTSYIVAQAHVLGAYSTKVSVNHLEFSKCFIDNKITDIIECNAGTNEVNIFTLEEFI